MSVFQMLFNMLLYLLSVLVLLCLIHVTFNYNGRARMMKKIPGPQLDFIVGNGLTIMRSVVDVLAVKSEYCRRWPGIFRLWFYPCAAVVIYNPDDVQKILSSKRFTDKSVVYSVLKPWLREGLVVSNGTKWQQRRKILTPGFHFNTLKHFFETIEDNGQRLVANFKSKLGQPIEVASIVSEFTLNSICETAMSTRLDDGVGRSYIQAIKEFGIFVCHKALRVHLYVDFVFNMTTLAKKQQTLLNIIHSFTKNVIKQRKMNIAEDASNCVDNQLQSLGGAHNNKNKVTTMLDLLIAKEKEGAIDKIGIQEEVDTFIFAGLDTTTSALTFCFMLLANHKDVQDKIKKELDNLFCGSKRRITFEMLNEMKYIECCIKESLRLFPPIHFISRQLNKDTVLSNYSVPAGTHCHISIYDLHRNPGIYERPDEFDPDRFLPENSVARHPYAYVPFSAGPRNCIGLKFAMMEMKVAVAKTLHEFDLESVTRPEDIRFIGDIVLRNNEPILVNFIKRKR